MARMIDLARDFSEFPFGRYRVHGPFSGERFRDEQVVPALREGDVVVIDLSGARGLAPSFLEETFGGLIRVGFALADLDQRLIIKSETDPSLAAEARAYMQDAARYSAAH